MRAPRPTRPTYENDQAFPNFYGVHANNLFNTPYQPRLSSTTNHSGCVCREYPAAYHAARANAHARAYEDVYAMARTDGGGQAPMPVTDKEQMCAEARTSWNDHVLRARHEREAHGYTNTMQVGPKRVYPQNETVVFQKRLACGPIQDPYCPKGKGVLGGLDTYGMPVCVCPASGRQHTLAVLDEHSPAQRVNRYPIGPFLAPRQQALTAT